MANEKIDTGRALKSDEGKEQARDKLALVSIQFRDAVHVGGKYELITSWSSKTHGELLPCTERAGWFEIQVANGDVVTVPLANVVFVRRGKAA